MRRKWGSWNWGGKIVFFSACAALLSLFLPWLLDPLQSRTLSDLPIGTPAMLFALIAVPFAYPAYALWTGRRLYKVWGVVCAVFGFLLGGWIIHAITPTIPLNGPPGSAGPSISIYSPGSGANVYILSMICLAAGVLFYRMRPAT